MDYDLRQLRYFSAIANAGSFSRAAAELSVAQSALSHHISQMEARLTVQLFARTSKGVTLTESGRKLLEHARTILSAVDAATNDLRDSAAEPGGLVRIGITLTVAPALVPPLMARLSAQAPKVTLRIEERLSPHLVHAVAEGEMDIAVGFNAADDSRVTATALFEEDICLVGAPQVVGDAPEPIALEDALAYPLLLPGRDHVLRGMIDRVALFRSVPINVRHECLSLQSLFTGLEQGLGATLISKFSALPLWRSGKVVCRPVVSPTVPRRLFVSVSAERPLTAAGAIVKEIATACVRENLASGAWPDTRAIPS